jgi:hypothetical protein
MKEHELTEKLRDTYVKEVVGDKKERTVEDALQEALDNTTPEHAGHPDNSHYEIETDEESEWL